MQIQKLTDFGTSAEADETAVEPISQDAVFQILSNERRREILHILLCENTIDKSRLADELADRLDTKRKNIMVSLIQQHLPKLRRAEVIRQDRSQITAGPNYADVYMYIRDDGIRSRLSRLVK